MNEETTLDDQNIPDPRKAAFKELIEAQDAGVGVRESREQVARNHGIPVEEVIRIERDGIEGQWPPL
jgi:hypothetical protein